MNNIIKKCIDELNKEEFRKDYVIGMLETLYDIQNAAAKNPVPAVPAGEYIPTPATPGVVSTSGLKPVVPMQVSPELIAKLRGGAYVETFNVLNAPTEAPK